MPGVVPEEQIRCSSPFSQSYFRGCQPPLPAGSAFNDSQIAADRSSLRPYTVTYTTGVSRPSRAYLSNDRGQHWTDVTGDLAFTLTDASYWKLVANPSDQTQLFLGTDVGVYRSDNGGANWYRYSDGLPAVASIFGLELNFDQANPPLLHLGTYGRGFWDRQVAPDAASARAAVVHRAHLFPLAHASDRRADVGARHRWRDRRHSPRGELVARYEAGHTGWRWP